MQYKKVLDAIHSPPPSTPDYTSVCNNQYTRINKAHNPTSFYFGLISEAFTLLDSVAPFHKLNGLWLECLFKAPISGNPRVTICQWMITAFLVNAYLHSNRHVTVSDHFTNLPTRPHSIGHVYLILDAEVNTLLHSLQHNYKADCKVEIGL